MFHRRSNKNSSGTGSNSSSHNASCSSSTMGRYGVIQLAVTLMVVMAALSHMPNLSVDRYLGKCDTKATTVAEQQQQIMVSSSANTTLPMHDVCFVTSVYWKSVEEASDTVVDVSDLVRQHTHSETHSFGYYAYTNLPDLPTPGWTKIVTHLPYQRLITHSRWGKFMHWKESASHSQLPECGVVFYLDGMYTPKSDVDATKWLSIAQTIRTSSSGLMQQRLHVSKGPLHELERILGSKKDIRSNTDATKAWLEAQPNFDPNSPMYYNTWFGYDPHNAHYRAVADAFWEHYSQEVDSWRDQPLWSHSLHAQQVTPVPFDSPKALFPKLGAKVYHKYTAADNDNAGSTANAFRSDGTAAVGTMSTILPSPASLEAGTGVVVTATTTSASAAAGVTAAATSSSSGSSVQDAVTRCVGKTPQELADLDKEINHYEASQKFKDKLKEVQGTMPMAAHHVAIQTYLRDAVLDPDWSVLELGCAAGMMLQVVRNLYRDGIGSHGAMVGVELVPGWAKFAQEYFVGEHAGIDVFRGDITEFQLPAPYEKKTFDFVMLNDVMEHIEKDRYGCFFQNLRTVTHEGSIVYMHTPSPKAQIFDSGQFFENVLPHHVVVMGMALAGFELVTFEYDVDTKCGGRMPKTVPRHIRQSKCAMGEWGKYTHNVFQRVSDERVFTLD